MSNIQAEELIRSIKASASTKAHLRHLSDSISQLYCHSIITRASMQSARQKLLRYIAAKDEATHDQP